MRPSEIRARILADHDALRDVLDDLELRAQELREDVRRRPHALRFAAARLLVRLEEHMRWEDRFLVPALRAADAWGEERATRVERDHREQREMLLFLGERLRDPGRPAAVVAADVAALIEQLRRDIREEEQDLLDDRVLRDDVVGIGVATG